MIIRPYDISNKEMYYTMLCEEIDRMGLENRVVDVAKGYLYQMFFCEE